MEEKVITHTHTHLELNNTYNMDCIDGLNQMIKQGILVDCILTDSPYGINFNTNYRKKNNLITQKGILNDKDNNDILQEAIELSYKVLKNNSHIYWFTRWDKVPEHLEMLRKYYNVKNALVWVKNNWSMGDLKGAYAGQYEIILFGQKGRKELNEIDGTKRHTDILYYDRVSGNKQIHNHQKPINMLQFLIKKSTNEGETILDMFAGVRSTEIAARLCGRKYIGFELDEDIYKLGLQRDNELNVINY